MKNFFKEIKERKVRKWLAIYFSSCITIIGLVNLFSFRYQLPRYIFDSLIVIVSFGFVSAAVLAWYHGKEGTQKIKKREIVIHSIILISSLITIYFVTSKVPLQVLSPNSKIVAVLPFVNMSDSKEDEYFSDGITEDILTQLSKISDLKVISRTSIMKYKNSNLNIKEIGVELGAGTILEGSIRKFGNKVRVTGQLINANNDEHLWAETYDRKLDDIFEVQSEIAKKIANELEAKLAPKEELLIDSKPTENIEAYALVLRGREIVQKLTDENNEEGIKYYKKALEIDPNYALAYASLASAYDQKVRRYFHASDWQDSAIAMSKKALEINPNLSEGHSSLAKSYEARGDFQLAKYHYEEAIRLNPNAAASIYNLGVLHYNNGNLDEAFKLVKKSVVLKPDDVFCYIVLGGIYRKFGCEKLSFRWFNNALSIDPKSRMVLLYLIDNYIFNEDFLNATKYHQKLLQLYPNFPYTLFHGAKLELLKKNFVQAKKYFEKGFEVANLPKSEYQYGYILKKLNQEKEGEKILNEQLDIWLEDEKINPNKSNLSARILADIYAIKRENGKSLEWMEKSIDRGWTEYKEFLIFPYMENLKTNEVFIKQINRLKAKIDSMKTIAIKYEANLEFCE